MFLTLKLKSFLIHDYHGFFNGVCSMLSCYTLFFSPLCALIESLLDNGGHTYQKIKYFCFLFFFFCFFKFESRRNDLIFYSKFVAVVSQYGCVMILISQLAS